MLVLVYNAGAVALFSVFYKLFYVQIPVVRLAVHQSFYLSIQIGKPITKMLLVHAVPVLLLCGASAPSMRTENSAYNGF